MTRGAILFAFNSEKFNYYEMAEYTAKRIEHFLDLPVTLVTDKQSIPKKPKYNFDNTVTVKPDKTNVREWGTWINKGRYQAYELSPYDETLLLDVDYMVNSDRLLKIFDYYDDFTCHEDTTFLMEPVQYKESLSAKSHRSLWATVVGFKKTKRAQNVFDSMKMIQNNYEHYAHIHGFLDGSFRNDFALTLALRLVNGHTLLDRDILPWNLTHIGPGIKILPNTDKEYNTEYTIIFDHWKRNKLRKEYIVIKDFDFHTINKEVFIELMS